MGPALETLLQTVPHAAAIFDTEMRYLAHNERWLLAHGAPADRSVAGLVHYDVFPEISDEWRSVHQRCLAGATERRDLDVFTRADGVKECMRWVVAPWRTHAKEIGGIAIYVENVTEQERTRRTLAERESLIRDLFEKSPIGLNLCRMDGLWLESNPAFLDIIGYGSEEANGGLTYWQLTPRKYDAEEAIQLELLRTRGRYGPYEKEFIRKDGGTIPVRLNGFLIEREGEPFIWSLIEDLTTQRKLEAQLEEEQLKAIQASKLATLGEMAAGIAHELNNPLGIIDGYAFALKAAIARGDAAVIEEAIGAIRSAADRAGKIVRGLRRFARQSELDDLEELEVRAVIDDAFALCRSRISLEGVELIVSVDTNARVRANPIEIGQVLVNLLNNALDAVRLDAGRGEESSAPARWIRVTAYDEAGGMVAIAVEDSGGGISPEHAADIFRAFFTTKKAGEGTGLGLSISRSIVERYRGSLLLDAASPHTRFVVRIPRVTA